MSWYIEEQERVYLDYNATTPIDGEAEKAIIEALKYWANPSSNNPLGRKAREIVESARGDLARLLRVSPKEVFFTSGGTEANTWVIHNAVEHYKAVHGREVKPHVVCSAIEHPSILEPLRDLKSKGEIDCTEVGIDPDTGCIKLDELQLALCDRTCLVSLMLVNNETGVIQPVAEVAAIARKAEDSFDSRVIVHTDAAQAIGKIAVNPSELKADFITVVGHKFYGPRIGALVVPRLRAVPLKALFLGGGQEDNKRSGTENTPMIAGLGAAARVVEQNFSKFSDHMRDVRDYFEEQLKAAMGDEVVIHFAGSSRIPNTSSVSFVNYKGDASELLSKCKSFIASTGAACHAGVKSVSPVLAACKISNDVALRTVRFSFGRDTSRIDVDRVVDELKSISFLNKYGSSLLGAINKGPVPGF